jgi:hypothetical protein
MKSYFFESCLKTPFFKSISKKNTPSIFNTRRTITRIRLKFYSAYCAFNHATMQTQTDRHSASYDANGQKILATQKS